MQPSDSSKLILPPIGPKALSVHGTSIKFAGNQLKAAKGIGPIKPYQANNGSAAVVDPRHEAQSSFSTFTLPTIIENKDEV